MKTSFRNAFGAALLLVAGCAFAQANVMKLVVPYPAGGITDQAARIVGERMARELGQTVIVDNRPGAAGRIAIDAVAKAAADGNTLLFTNSSYSILPIVDPHVRFDPLKTLTPFSLVATYGLQIVTTPQLPVNSMQEFIAYAKSHPGKLSYGSSGVGSGAHFAGEYFKSLTGRPITWSISSARRRACIERSPPTASCDSSSTLAKALQGRGSESIRSVAMY